MGLKTSIYAAGFNAWGQVLFKPSSAGDGLDKQQPEDVRVFTQMLTHDTVRFDDAESFLTYTLVRTRSGDPIIVGAITPELRTLHSPPKRREYSLIAEGPRGIIVVLDRSGNLKEYASAKDLCDNKAPMKSFPGFSDVFQLLGHEAGFVALDREGRVYTWGDERYTMCLGREVMDESPADVPGVVPDLIGLPTGKITKIAAGGYTLAALTEEGDLYCWGNRPGKAPILEGLGVIPNLVDLQGKEIVDVGVGDSHMIAFASNMVEDEVWVVGNNSNGQLGIETLEQTKTWTRVDLGLPWDKAVVAVRAGPRTSLIIVKDIDDFDGADLEMAVSSDEITARGPNTGGEKKRKRVDL